jgi:hypothetical protein
MRVMASLLISAATLLMSACDGRDQSVDHSQIMPMLGAVMTSDVEEVRRLAAKGVGLNERDPAEQATPMIEAAEIDQWPMVEILIDHGADVYAHDQFGITAPPYTLTSRVLRGSEEDKARLRVIDKLKARGYPWPPPKAEEVLALAKAGRWPPPGVRR